MCDARLLTVTYCCSFNDANVEIMSIEVREPDLEAVFLHLTGRALRD